MFLVILQSEGEAQELFNEYVEMSGEEPLFPIVTKANGGGALGEILGMPGAGGPCWIIHPSLKIELISYLQPALNNSIAAALESVNLAGRKNVFINDNCVIKNIGNNSVIIKNIKDGTYNLTLYTLSGKEIVSGERKIFNNAAVRFSQSLLQGFYLIKLEGYGIQINRKLLIIK